MMKLDPQLQPFIESINNARGTPAHLLPPETLREISTAKLVPTVYPPGMTVSDYSVALNSHSINVRVYRAQQQGVSPCLLFLHGGGWVTGNIATHDQICVNLASGADCTVVALEYSLAPENPFPCALDECDGVLQWLLENSAKLQIDPARIAIGGDSAGGNLTAALTLRLRDRNDRFRPLLQLLLYPVLDDNVDRPSYLRNAKAPFLDRAIMIYCLKRYLEEGKHSDNPYALPLKAEDLSNLPDAFVVTCGHDPLMDEGDEYAKRLIQAGVNCEYRHNPSLIHGFLRCIQISAESEKEHRAICQALQRVFAN